MPVWLQVLVAVACLLVLVGTVFRFWGAIKKGGVGYVIAVAVVMIFWVYLLWKLLKVRF